MDLTKSQKLLYILVKKQGVIEDKTKLAKLQHFADFIHYAFHDKPISEETYYYQKRKQGPLALNFNHDLDVLKQSELIEEKPLYTYKLKKVVDIRLSREEIRTILYVLKKFGNCSYKELVNLSHKQIPYLSAKEGGIIDYSTAYNLIDDYQDYED